MYYLIEAYKDTHGRRTILDTQAAYANQIGGMVIRMLKSGASVVEVCEMSEETFQLFYKDRERGAGAKAKDEQI